MDIQDVVGIMYALQRSESLQQLGDTISLGYVIWDGYVEHCRSNEGRKTAPTPSFYDMSVHDSLHTPVPSISDK